jgi:tRNA/tmRNA/rRNA uracil-C5-methylase (TrmA/RlmC/RlmD family)
MRKLRGKTNKNERRLGRLQTSTTTTNTSTTVSKVLDREKRIATPSKSTYLREVMDRLFVVGQKSGNVSVRQLFKQRYRYKTFFFSSRKRRVDATNRSFFSEKKKRT